jgi:poly(3-hydroxyalkanoate) synthetase
MPDDRKGQYDCVKALSETEFFEDLKSIVVPVLVMHGEDDQICPWDGLFDLIKSAPATLKYEPSTIVAEGDFVIVHGRYSGLALAANWVVADIVRMKEHWEAAFGRLSCGFVFRFAA